jgi:molybdopterin synthase sulfur carrier subunit
LDLKTFEIFAMAKCTLHLLGRVPSKSDKSPQGFLMKVVARYFAGVREIVGAREETLDLPDSSTVQDLLVILCEKYGAPLRNYILVQDSGQPSKNLNFLVDGRNVSLMDGLQTPLHEGCAFAIIPPVGGGTV